MESVEESAKLLTNRQVLRSLIVINISDTFHEGLSFVNPQVNIEGNDKDYRIHIK